MARSSLVEFVKEYATLEAEIAVVHRRGYRMEHWTYARVVEEACRLARELEARGIGKGDAVLLWGNASAEWIAAFFGCLLRGAVVVPIDPVATLEFATRVGREVHARLLLRSQKIADAGFPIASLMLESLPDNLANHSPSFYPSPPLERRDTLEIIFTSGTTAEPRGVLISHGNVLANIEPIEREIRRYLRYERLVHPLRFLNLLPMSHIFGQLLGVFLPPLLGATVVFVDSLKPPDLIQTVRRERVSILVAVPRILESLQHELERGVEQRDGARQFQRNFTASEGQHFLRRWWKFRSIHRDFGWKFWAFISGGAALPEGVETFWTRLGFAVIQGYGMTETTSLISLNHPFRSAKGSIGKVFPGTEVRVDESGEILVRGESLATAYRQGETVKPVADEGGWFRTGDLAEMGSDGQLFFKGRQKNVIVTPAGMNVYPEDLERALRCQLGIKDCVVVGIERDGNTEPCAVLILSNYAPEGGQIVAAANQSLAEYQRIREWREWPEPDFPRGPTQKPLLARIREWANTQVVQRNATAGSANTLASIISRVIGRSPDYSSTGEALESELNLSSFDRVEVMSALEDRYHVDLSEVKFSEARTLGQIERLLQQPQVRSAEYSYPRWPQNWFVRVLRLAVYYGLIWPATYLLAAPKVIGRENLRGIRGPALLISNHVTYVDIGWILAALPADFRHRLATAMLGERLAQLRNPSKDVPWFVRPFRRLGYLLVLALFNVFPLPKESGFRKSFLFAGDLADRGWSILVFPEGVTTQNGHLAPFRAGIGLLATRLNIPVVPMRIDGLFELKQARRRTARPGQVQVTIGKPVRFPADQNTEEIAHELQRRVSEL